MCSTQARKQATASQQPADLTTGGRNEKKTDARLRCPPPLLNSVSLLNPAKQHQLPDHSEERSKKKCSAPAASTLELSGTLFLSRERFFLMFSLSKALLQSLQLSCFIFQSLFCSPNLALLRCSLPLSRYSRYSLSILSLDTFSILSWSLLNTHSLSLSLSILSLEIHLLNFRRSLSLSPSPFFFETATAAHKTNRSLSSLCKTTHKLFLCGSTFVHTF